ncbi:MAG: hypothetical protein WCH79_15140, partial [Planctomycetia bacterium]
MTHSPVTVRAGVATSVTLSGTLQPGDLVEVLSGLEAGERVVTRANFLVDSESRMRAAAAGPPEFWGVDGEGGFDGVEAGPEGDGGRNFLADCFLIGVEEFDFEGGGEVGGGAGIQSPGRPQKPVELGNCLGLGPCGGRPPRHLDRHGQAVLAGDERI